MKKQLLVLIAVLFSVAAGLSAADNAKVYTVDQVFEQAPSLVGQTVQIKGVCKHVCAVSGRKLFLQASDGKLIRVNAGAKIDKFDRAVLGKEVTVSGTVVEQRITKAILDKQETLALEAEKKQAKGEHCATEAKANGEDVKATPVQRIRAQKDKLDKQIAAGGKDYFATYTIGGCNDYSFAK